MAGHLTLYHWDLPQGLQDDGGWMSRDTAHRFADYAARSGAPLRQSPGHHRHPQRTLVHGQPRLRQRPVRARRRGQKQAIQVSHHLLLSHGLAMQAMRAAESEGQLGIVLNQWTAEPATDSAADQRLAALEWANSIEWFMDPIFKKRYPELSLQSHGADAPEVQDGDFDIIAQPIDFLGVNYYRREVMSAEVPPRKPEGGAGFTDMGWEIYPQGLTDLLVQLKAQYPALPPVYITENGMASVDALQDGQIDDQQRIDYVRTHLEALKAAMDQGIDVRGYFLWSLMDNFEWNSGYAKRFGIVWVDYDTLERTPKASALWYRDYIARQRAALRAA
jgi:beta-glucosidase